MGRDQHIIDEFKRYKRLCTELAADSRLPEERAACLRRQRTTVLPPATAIATQPGRTG
jgi:hypothetical protein